ncbi:DNA repair exonuclease [Pseudohoeflea suaedae]|uniref:DNA repair exonuclease n=1 Tax=Pseudohoeflea suaedae TaxID=877384 RepID=A0A4V3A754_9HYPH|nr:DNA repair exonuclease [Pseudohoeflea suaedae]TDH36282.1 DNA repair exonuclease [Pseudohoeflea suaedae]
MTFRFIHSSDLHLGKRFGQFPGDLPAKLREARHAAIGKLAEHARSHGASTVLLAGDTFDTETPAPDVRRQALAEMSHHAPIRWVILPGNHDSLQAAQLWATLHAEAPENVTLAVDPEPIELASGVVLLPAPCTFRRPGKDLSEWFDNAPTPDGAIRIGLAHGGVLNFSEEDGGLDVIAPDRARRAGLAYLALGDWHGGLEIDPRTRYSGTPEPDRFKHDREGEALLVAVPAPSAMPEVSSVRTGTFSWRDMALDLLDGDDAVTRLDALLPEPRARRQSLLNIVASGRARLEGRSALAAWIDELRPDFAHLELHDDALETECDAGDLDAIDRAGALREAADALLAESEDAQLSQAERDIARAALARLYAQAQVIAP